MADKPFITRELDRRIVAAQASINAGKVDATAANAGLMPWAAAEAWLAGPHVATSPRDGQSCAADLCSIDDTIAELTRARDALASVIENKNRLDLLDHWRGMVDAVRRLERQRDWNRAWRSASQPAPPAPDDTQLPPAQTSLLADMFGPDGTPLPVKVRQAA